MVEDKFGVICRLVLLAATGAAVAFQVIFVMLDCRFVSFSSDDNSEREFGLFKLQSSTLQDFQNATFNLNATNFNNDTTAQDASGATFSASQDCVDYAWRSEESTKIRVAQACILLAIVGGGVGFLLVFFETCCLRVKCARILETLSYGMAILCSGLVFLVLDSQVCSENGGCNLSKGAIFNIAAMVLYGIAVTIMVCTPKPKPFCCGAKGKTVERDDAAMSVGDNLSPTSSQPGTLQVEEGAWGAMPHGRTQYE
ncbi:hypothetical protein MPSEU_000746200 [Mayamaea pseudoterrestris]|nr:hypothetical protein MPSEU_000746200 [Mayamaea pseudoterrestris]